MHRDLIRQQLTQRVQIRPFLNQTEYKALKGEQTRKKYNRQHKMSPRNTIFFALLVAVVASEDVVEEKEKRYYP